MPVEQFGIDMLGGQVDEYRVLHVGGHHEVVTEGGCRPSDQLLRCGIGAEFDRALLGYCAEFVPAVPTPGAGDRSGGHRNASSSARTAHCANRSPSSRCSTKLRTTRSM